MRFLVSLLVFLTAAAASLVPADSRDARSVGEACSRLPEFSATIPQLPEAVLDWEGAPISVTVRNQKQDQSRHGTVGAIVCAEATDLQLRIRTALRAAVIRGREAHAPVSWPRDPGAPRGPPSC